MLECKGVMEESARRCFVEVSESRHSPLVLVGAPAQGCCYPLVHARTKCSLRADSSTLRRCESPKTAHKLDTSQLQELWAVFVPPITTEPSRRWRSPRVTSKELSLDPNKALESGGCTLDSWNSLEKDSLKKSLKSQSSLGSCYSLAPQQVSQMFKWARDLSWTRWRSINTPHEVQRSANRFPLKTGSPDAVNVAPDALHRAFGDTQRLTVPASDRSPDATS